jgi:hypothetical protein
MTVIRTNIRYLAESHGFTAAAFDAMPESLQDAYLSFEEWHADSDCGKECLKLIELAKPLLDASDPSAHPQIWRGVVAAMAVVCCG